MPEPVYAHVPVLTEADDTKLAKSRRSVRVDQGEVLPQLLAVFAMLGLRVPAALTAATVADAWDWATGMWDIGQVPKRLNVRCS
jgi:glutamyl-Q tRNA(Asp) synthetase